METKARIQELEERVMALETRSAYQERTIDTLDQVIQDQFKLIDSITDQLKQLRSKIAELPITTEQSNLKDEVPPHY